MYTDPRSLDPSTYQYPAQLPDGRLVYGTMSEIQDKNGALITYEQGVALGNDWDSLSQPRR